MIYNTSLDVVFPVPKYSEALYKQMLQRLVYFLYMYVCLCVCLFFSLGIGLSPYLSSISTLLSLSLSNSHVRSRFLSLSPCLHPLSLTPIYLSIFSFSLSFTCLAKVYVSIVKRTTDQTATSFVFAMCFYGYFFKKQNHYMVSGE